MEDLISVIVPVYNVSDYLNKCISSIINQSYNNLEIILVNDGSTDHSLEICNSFASCDDRIKVVNKINGGLSDARNAGIENSKGKYLVFIDGDDYIDPMMIEKLYVSIIENQSDVSICSFRLVDDFGKTIKTEFTNDSLGKTLSGKDLLKLTFLRDGYKYIVVWNKLYKKELFNELRFEKGRIYEDELLNYKLFWNLSKVSFVDYIGYNYVQRDNSIVGSKKTLNKIKMKNYCHEDKISFYSEYDKEGFYLSNAKQKYCNWLINVLSFDKDLFTKDLFKEYKKTYKKNVISLAKDRNIELFYRITDFIGQYNVSIILLLNKLRGNVNE